MMIEWIIGFRTCFMMVPHHLESSIAFNQHSLCSGACHLVSLSLALVWFMLIRFRPLTGITSLLCYSDLWPLSRGHSCHLAATLHHLNRAGGKPSTCSKHVTHVSPTPPSVAAEQPLCKEPPVAMPRRTHLHANEQRPFTERRHQGVKWAPPTAAGGWATAALTPACRLLLLIPLLISFLFLLLIFSLLIPFLFSFIILPCFY